MREIYTALGFKRTTRNFTHRGAERACKRKMEMRNAGYLGARNSLVVAGHGHGGGRRGREMSREGVGNKVGKVSQGRL